MEMLEKIADLLEEMGYEFDYIWDSGDRVVVVKVYAEYNHFLFEAKDLYGLLSIIERKRDEINGLF